MLTGLTVIVITALLRSLTIGVAMGRQRRGFSERERLLLELLRLARGERTLTAAVLTHSP